MSKSRKLTVVYMRVSTSQQSHRSQKPDIERWLTAQNPDELGQVVWYTDIGSGRSTNHRPGWAKLQAAIEQHKVRRIVCWRLDRLGRSASALCALFDQLREKNVDLVSLRESVSLRSAGGRLLADVLAAVAAFESELKSERIVAGQAAARAAGRKWGGSKKGRRIKVTDEQLRCILAMHQGGHRITAIARTTALNRSTCYRVLRNFESGTLEL